MKLEQKDLITRFLLGKLTQEKVQEIEENYFTNKSFFEDILIAENELIDKYSTGCLSDDDRARFEQRLLINPHQHLRIEFSKLLKDYAANYPLDSEK